jgi:class 3 adenylate cyclase/tetratricopeptide (TPR) repeat protein
MHCARCGFDNPPGFTFCGKCGSSLAPACSRCGAPAPTGFAFCGKCGAPLHAANDSLSAADLEHLYAYLPEVLLQALRFDAIAPPPRLLESCLTHLNQLLNLTQSHLPSYLVERVGRDPTPGRTDGQFVYGTLLFADISGFTAMSERLSRIGREGAEEITGIVNRYFNLMLAILRERDGQLIKFGGDALLALFLDPSPSSDVAGVELLPQRKVGQIGNLPNGGDSATRATQAALTMQVAMGGFAQTKTSQGVFPLQMKIALQRGRFFAAQLGTAQNMEHALFGVAVNATAVIEAAASAGQVVMDRATLTALTATAQANPLTDFPNYMLVEQIESASPLGALPTVALNLSSEPTLANLKRTVKLLDTLTPYLPAGLLARIAHNPQAISLEGEHRLVALLFANVYGLGELADRLGPGRETQIVSALNQYFVAMEHGVQHYGGIINKIDLFEHGDKLMAFFGAPLAHEDDAERAVRAALTMQETLQVLGQSVPAAIGLNDLRLTQRIGVSYGYVFAGYVGTGWRHEYTVMGDEVNLAARLMSAAKDLTVFGNLSGLGHIIASSNVQRKTQALFEFDARGTVNLKGKRLPVPIFAVQGVRAVPKPLRGLAGMRSPLVGRDAEWQQLQNAMTQLLAGRGQIVSVMGEAGLGKSRLVAELRQHALQRFKVQGSRFDGQPSTLNLEPSTLNLQWLEGRCLSYTETVSYTPFLEIMRQLTGIANEDGEEVAWNKLRESVMACLTLDEATQQLPYLANFLNLTLTSDLQEKIRYLDAEALQRRTFVALSAFIEAAARRTPLVLALEDIHWIDQASQALLEHLMPLVNRAPLLLLLLYRPDRDRRCWQLHEKATRELAYCHTAVTLQKLGAQDSQQMLAHLLQRDLQGFQNLAGLLTRAEGNPLYLEEVIRSLIDANALLKDEAGHWQIVNDEAVRQVPDTLQGVIMARLDRLPEACRWTAQLASVIGRAFALDVLENIIGAQSERAQLNDCLALLQQHEISRETQRLPEIIYAFKHVMIQEVCYNSLLIRVRRQTHRKIAAYLEGHHLLGHRESENFAPLIAHHAFEGQDWPRALKYQWLAGQQAQQLFANQAAIVHYQKAMQSAEKLPMEETTEQRLSIFGVLGELLTTTGQYDQALLCLNSALQLAQERNEFDTQARVCRWLARWHELRGEYVPAFAWIEQGLKSLGGRETTEAAQLLLNAALIHTHQGHYEQALKQARQALQLAERLDELTTQARANNVLGIVAHHNGDYQAAVQYFQLALLMYQRASDIQGQTRAHNNLANMHFAASQWTQAEHHYRRAREYAVQLSDVNGQILAANNLGGLARNLGRLDEAITFYRDALNVAQRFGIPHNLGSIHMNLGATFIRRGEVGTAREHLQASVRYFEPLKAREFLPEVHRHFAEAALLAHELAEAETQARQSLRLATELAAHGEEGYTLRVLGEVSTAREDFADAAERLQESIAILNTVGDEYERARSELAWARLQQAQGQVEAARETAARCLAVFERLEARLDVEAARELQAQLL